MTLDTNFKQRQTHESDYVTRALTLNNIKHDEFALHQPSLNDFMITFASKYDLLSIQLQLILN